MSLDWPAGFARTQAANREPTSNFQASVGDTTDALEVEMRRLDPAHWRADIGNQHVLTNGLPRHNAAPDDPGFVLRWTKDGEEFAVACDAYAQLRDNLREVYLWVHETRLRAQRAVETGESEFAAARLPPADTETVVAAGPAGEEPAHEILEIPENAPDAVVEAAYREKLKEAHPDRGGSEAEFRRVREAREAMLDE